MGKPVKPAVLLLHFTNIELAKNRVYFCNSETRVNSRHGRGARGGGIILVFWKPHDSCTYWEKDAVGETYEHIFVGLSCGRGYHAWKSARKFKMHEPRSFIAN